MGLPPTREWAPSALATMLPVSRLATATAPLADPTAATGHLLRSTLRMRSSHASRTLDWHCALTHRSLRPDRSEVSWALRARRASNRAAEASAAPSPSSRLE